MAGQRRRAKKEWADRIGVRIPAQVWQDTRAAFVADLETGGEQAPATHEAWCEQALYQWVALGVRVRKTHPPVEGGGETTARPLRLATLTRKQLHQAWASDGAPENLSRWITRGLTRAIEDSRRRHDGDLPTPPERLPTWRTDNPKGDEKAET